VNLAVVFRSARGLASGTIMRSAELRTFFVLIGGLSITVAVVADGAGNSVEQLRGSLFAVVSMLSTTGLWATDWGTWSQGGQTLLMLAAGIGAMSGAIGGGFRVARMLAMLGFIRREVLRQLHPRAVLVVKVGRRTVNEALVDRIVGHQVLYLFVGGIGSVSLAIAGASVLTSLTGAVSALSTVGPAMGELTPGGGAETLSAPARAVLMPLMILGRLELAPVLVGLAAIVVRRRPSRQE
jgi:trk system potassium uptake protein TrkH